MDESALIFDAQHGSLTALEELIDRYQGKIFSITLTHTRNREDAMDISQEVFMKMYKHIRHFDNTRNFFPWLYSIMMNTLRSYMNKNKKYRKNQGTDFLDEVELIDQPGMSIEDKLCLFNALDELDSKDKELIILKYFEDLSIQEIAQICSMGESNVKVSLMRARNRMKAFVGGLK